MKERTCEFCGTEFDARLNECPLCGKTVQAPVPDDAETYPAPKRAKERAAEPIPIFGEAEMEVPENKKPRAGKGRAIACIVLGILVVAAALVIMYDLCWFGEVKPLLAYHAPAIEQREEETRPEDKQKDPPPEKQQEEKQEEKQPEQQEEKKPPEEEIKIVLCTMITCGTSSVTFEEKEEFHNLTVTVLPSNCTESVEFTSGDDQVATVNAQGKIVAVGAGTTIVTATCGTKSATCLVTCDFKSAPPEEENPPEEKVEPPSLSTDDMTLFYPGEKARITVKNIPKGGAPITFSVANAGIATVTDNGEVTAVKNGTTTVKVQVGDTELECIVRCRIDDSAETGSEGGSGTYTINHSDVTMSLRNEYFQLNLKDSNGDRVKGVVWTTSDPSVCTIDSSVSARYVNVYAVGSGTAYVTANFEGTTYTCIVRCKIS